MQVVLVVLADIDFFLRLAAIVFYGISFGYLLHLYGHAKEHDLATTRTFFLSFSLFFLFTMLNYLVSEINLFFEARGQPSIYPQVIPETFSINLGFASFNPVNSDVFLFFFFLLATIPMTFAIEKYSIQRKVPAVTLMGLVGLGLLAGEMVLDNILYSHVAIVYAYLMLVVMTLGILHIYVKMILMTTGEPRKTAVFLTVGFVVQFVGLVITSLGLLPEGWGEVVGHGVSLAGMGLLFGGLVRMK